MRHFLKTIHQFSLLANYDKIDKTCSFFKLVHILPICISAVKRGIFFISYTEYKIQKFLFIHHKSISLSIHLTFIMPGIKEAKHFTKTASSDSKSEDLHDDSIYIVKHQTKFTIHSKKEWKSFH